MTADLQKRLLRDMVRINRVELRIEARYHHDQMKTPVHLCIGQEAIAVGMCAALDREDYVNSTHRSHGHYLAKGGDLNAMIAELHCKDTGCSRGIGGSMHLVDPSVGLLGSSSIVGGGIPLATGLGLAAALRKDRRVSVVFFGDGAHDEGVLYESVNFAVLKELPVLFVYENNQWSVCSHVSTRYKGESIFHRTDQALMPSRVVDGNDVEAVHAVAEEAVARGRAGKGPTYIECRTYRMRGHAGSGSDVKLGYRAQGEIDEWEARCPMRTYADRLLREGVVAQGDIDRMTDEIEREVDAAFTFAESSSLPSVGTMHQYLFRT